MVVSIKECTLGFIMTSKVLTLYTKLPQRIIHYNYLTVLSLKLQWGVNNQTGKVNKYPLL